MDYKINTLIFGVLISSACVYGASELVTEEDDLRRAAADPVADQVTASPSEPVAVPHTLSAYRTIHVMPRRLLNDANIPFSPRNRIRRNSYIPIPAIIEDDAESEPDEAIIPAPPPSPANRAPEVVNINGVIEVMANIRNNLGVNQGVPVNGAVGAIAQNLPQWDGVNTNNANNANNLINLAAPDDRINNIAGLAGLVNREVAVPAIREDADEQDYASDFMSETLTGQSSSEH